ncbi:uncharacterized protein [Nicotiana tomentosiformis]|uniref:uncharacterized protein n=1 Tax=Nicotiana tomentosiformis TaxID=4098 RepID=UPI00388C8C0D
MILIEFGMPVKFVQLVIECVTTVSYSLLINGGLTTKFQAKKGLRQGDPMSPYLFVLVMEYLNRSLKTLECIPHFNYHLRGIKGVQRIDSHRNAINSKRVSIQVFLLPKKITKLIVTGCRTFLWTGSNEPSKRALIAWDKICMPLSARGLNVLDVSNWNKATLCKLIWAINAKKDTMWIQWIHRFYIKGEDIMSMHTPKQACWLVRKIFDTREWLIQNDSFVDLNKYCINEKFSIKKMYVSTIPQHPKCHGKGLQLIQKYYQGINSFCSWPCIES